MGLQREIIETPTKPLEQQGQKDNEENDSELGTAQELHKRLAQSSSRESFLHGEGEWMVTWSLVEKLILE